MKRRMAFVIRSLKSICKKQNAIFINSSTFGLQLTRFNIISPSKKFYSSNLGDFFNDIGRPSYGPVAKAWFQESAKKSWKRKKSCFIIFGSAITIGILWTTWQIIKPEYNDDDEIIPDQFVDFPFYIAIFKRIGREFSHYKQYYQNRIDEKMLPVPLKDPGTLQPRYTLVLEVIDLLVHPEYIDQIGWAFKKRPGVDQFLEQLTIPNFEIVVFTTLHAHTVYPILDSLDPNGYITYRLVHRSTRLIDGRRVKDLRVLNRDLSKVIVIDWNMNSTKLYPRNTFLLPRWTGNDNDTTLNDLTAFLKMIHATNVDDVRDILTHYQQFDNPLEAFKQIQKTFQQIEYEKEKKKSRQNSKTLVSRVKLSLPKTYGG